jgi:hypothetical protein
MTPTLSARGSSLAALAALLAAPLVSQEPVPADFRGEWVPATETCASQVRFLVTASEMTLVRGADRQKYGDIAIAHSFFGPDYQGISVVAMPDFETGEPPFTVTFNAEERRGVTVVEIHREIAGQQNAAVRAIQDRSRALARRFPRLNLVPLKKCP